MLKSALLRKFGSFAGNPVVELVRNTPFVKSFYLNCRHSKASLIGSLDDDIASQSCDHLISLVARSSEFALTNFIDSHLTGSDSQFLNVFPGEHYKILSGIIQAIDAKNLIDIGTYTGMSARVMIDFSSTESRIQTYDIVSWNHFNSHLTPTDFDNKCTQHLVDLSQTSVFNEHLPYLDNADLIFCDAPKDGLFEEKFLTNLSHASFSSKPRYLMLDDIRFLNMASLWRSIASPKFDLTSFGHWSGTGIVDISSGLIFK